MTIKRKYNLYTGPVNSFPIFDTGWMRPWPMQQNDTQQEVRSLVWLFFYILCLLYTCLHQNIVGFHQKGPIIRSFVVFCANHNNSWTKRNHSNISNHQNWTSPIPCCFSHVSGHDYTRLQIKSSNQNQSSSITTKLEKLIGEKYLCQWSR